VFYQPTDTASYSCLSTKLRGVTSHYSNYDGYDYEDFKYHTKGRSFENINIIKDVRYNLKKGRNTSRCQQRLKEERRKDTR
jgi:hypothetical protein